MKRVNKNVTVLAACTALFYAACSTSPYPGYEKSESGLYAKFYTNTAEGISPKEGDMVSVIMYYKNNKDSILFDSRTVGKDGSPAIEFPLGVSTFEGSFEEALSMMKVGDSASFIISADSVYLKTFKQPELPKYVEKGSMLTFEAKLQKITSKAEADEKRKQAMEERKVKMEMMKNEENNLLADYLAKNKITTKANESGLIYIEKTKGKGPKATKGCTVKVNYTGRLLDGTVFDTSDKKTAQESGTYNEQRPYEPIEFAVGMGEVIAGWDEGLMMMNAGTKAQFIVPSSIGYGEQGGGPIAPYSSLVFDVELVSFTAAK
jgi:FKBP-type peptidyl-prolyl cis-trans isomerase FkpA